MNDESKPFTVSMSGKFSAQVIVHSTGDSEHVKEVVWERFLAAMSSYGLEVEEVDIEVAPLN